MVRYGTLDKNGYPVYFTGVIYVDGKPVSNPTPAMYLANGQKPFLDNKSPAAPAGYRYLPVGWKEKEKSIVRAWKLVSTARPKPKPKKRTFVTADVIEGLMKAGVWPQVRAYIESEGMLDMVLATKSFREDDPNFTEPRDALKAALGWTDEQVEAVLAASVWEGAV